MLLYLRVAAFTLVVEPAIALAVAAVISALYLAFFSSPATIYHAGTTAVRANRQPFTNAGR